MGGVKGGTTEQIPLPLPKNHVMMTLMELSAYSVQKFSYSEEDGDDLVFDGIQSLGGHSGTYVVKEKSGLVVHPQHPRHRKTASEDDFWKFDSSASFFSAKSSSGDLEKNDSNGERHVIGYGQRVQVVNQVDGAYKLARNQGFVIANYSQLVKIGAPLEECCKLEGVLSTITQSKLLLEHKLEKLCKTESNLNSQLSKQLSLPEKHPVIADAPQLDNHLTKSNIHNPYEDDRNDFEMTSSGRLSPSHTTTQSSYNAGIMITPTPASPPVSRTLSATGGEDFFHLSDEENDEEEDMDWRLQAISVVESLPDSIDDNRRPLSPFRRGIICGSSLFPGLKALSGDDDEASESANGIGGSVDVTSGTGIELNYREDAIAAFESHNRSRSWAAGLPHMRMNKENNCAAANINIGGGATSPTKKLDFRTGLSGHLALQSSSKLERRSSGSRTEVRMMGEHRGISSIGPMRKVNSPKSEGKKRNT